MKAFKRIHLVRLSMHSWSCRWADRDVEVEIQTAKSSTNSDHCTVGGSVLQMSLIRTPKRVTLKTLP